MSAGTFTFSEGQRAVHKGLPALAFWIAVLSLLPPAALFGGMHVLLMILAFGLAVIVWVHPQEAPGAGILFLLAASVLLPSDARFDYLAQLQPRQMYYWAAGLFIITAAACLRIGVQRILAIPISAKIFLAVALVASVYGLREGASARDVLSELYGLVLFVVYVGIALQVGSEGLLLRRIQTFGVLCAFCFFVYYASVFSKYGFHKEMAASATQAGLLAMVLFISGAERRKGWWVLGGLTLLVVPTLVFMRRDVITFLLSVLAAFTMKLKSKVLVVLCGSVFAVLATSAVFPPATEVLAENLLKVPIIGQVIPVGSQDADTLYNRMLQLGEAVNTVRTHPLLGMGVGAKIGWESTWLGFDQATYVDSGWGYLLQKTGLLGTCAFVWFLVVIFQNMSRDALALSACLFVLSLVALLYEPVFFHFTLSPFVGTFVGLLLARRCSNSTQSSEVAEWR